MEVRGKCCLICYKHDKFFVENNSSIVDSLKVIYGTIKFDDTLKHGRFCLSCSGRVQQLYQFFCICIHVASVIEPDRMSQCILCQKMSMVTEKDVTKEVVDFIFQSRLQEAFHSVSTIFQCCYSCYNFIDAFNDIKVKLKLFEDLKSSLVDFKELSNDHS